jgi:hypothetical protein
MPASPSPATPLPRPDTVKARLTPKRAGRQVETDEHSAFVRPILRAYARRVGDGDVEALTLMTSLADEIDADIAEAVKGLRACGYSWPRSDHASASPARPPSNDGEHILSPHLSRPVATGETVCYRYARCCWVELDPRADQSVRGFYLLASSQRLVQALYPKPRQEEGQGEPHETCDIQVQWPEIGDTSRCAALRYSRFRCDKRGVGLSPAAQAAWLGLGATPGATRMNKLRMLRTRMDNRETSSRSRTVLNGSGRPRGYLRI